MNDHRNQDYEWLLGRTRNAYQILSLDPKARDTISHEDIRRAYRKQALIKHPDKNKSSNAEEEFREVSVSYRILGDEKQREIYDEHLRLIETDGRDAGIRTKKTQGLKDALLRREEGWKTQERLDEKRQEKISRLQQEFEQVKRHRAETTYQTIASIELSRQVRVKWRNRPKLQKYINEDVIEKMMGVFGEVVNVKFTQGISNNSKYRYAIVTYQHAVSAALAAAHDYSDISIMQQLGMGKLATLLRSASIEGVGNVDLTSQQQKSLNLDDYLYLSISRASKII